MDPQLTKIITYFESVYGSRSGIIQTSEPYHGCVPSAPCGHEATALRIDGKTATVGWIWWDFANLPSYDEKERAGELPFDAWENSFSTGLELNLDNPGELRALLFILRDI